MDSVLLDIICNSITFLVCSWAILSNRINDGILIKLGFIAVSFSCLANIITAIDLNRIHSTGALGTDVGLALVGLGVFFRLEIYPKYVKVFANEEIICSITSPGVKLCRRKTDFKDRFNGDNNVRTT